MTRTNTMKQLFNLMQEEYEIQSAKDIELALLDELKARGFQDICIACVDGLSGFNQVIKAVFPHALVQRYLFHLIHQSTKFVSYQDRK